MADKKIENKRKARKNDFKKNKYYYAFVAIVLIIVLLVVALDYKFRFGFIEWPTSESTSESVEESFKQEFVGEVQNLTIKFIDVGQGDAIFITFPDGKNMLVDAGENKNEVKSTLDKNLTINDKKVVLDYVVATHSDSDHIGSLPYIYENYDVLKSYRPYTKSTNGNASFTEIFNKGYTVKESKVYYEYLLGIQNEKTPWEFFNDTSDFQTVVNSEQESYAYKVDFLMPYALTVDGFSSLGKNVNEVSAIIMIEFAGRKILLTGDIEEKAEEAFVSYCNENEDFWESVDCDVLKVAHHGSDTSSTIGFITAVKPEHAIISCGISNKYDHPCDSTIDNIIAVQNSLTIKDGKPIYRTDLHGTIVLTITPSGDMSFTVETTENDEFLLYNGVEIDEVADKIVK